MLYLFGTPTESSGSKRNQTQRAKQAVASNHRREQSERWQAGRGPAAN